VNVKNVRKTVRKVFRLPSAVKGSSKGTPILWRTLPLAVPAAKSIEH
jgi:hypothetical protein